MQVWNDGGEARPQPARHAIAPHTSHSRACSHELALPTTGHIHFLPFSSSLPPSYSPNSTALFTRSDAQADLRTDTLLIDDPYNTPPFPELHRFRGIFSKSGHLRLLPNNPFHPQAEAATITPATLLFQHRQTDFHTPATDRPHLRRGGEAESSQRGQRIYFSCENLTRGFGVHAESAFKR